MGATYTLVDDRTDARGLREALNRLVHRDAGNANYGQQVRWTQYDGVEKDPRTGATLSSNNHTLKIRNTAGRHVLIRNAADSANVLTIEDTGLSTPLDLSARDLTATRDLLLTGTGARITADLSNGTHANRLMFQSSTTNGTSNVGVIPNGSATQGSFNAYNNSNLAAASALQLQAQATQHRILSGNFGGGVLPIQVVLGATTAVGWDSTGLSTFYGDILLNASPWTTFTPGLTQNGARTVTVTYARYRVFGKVAHVQLQLVCTNAGAAGFSIVVTGIPAAIAPARTGQMAVCGIGMVEDLSATTFYFGAAYNASSTTLELMAHATAAVSPIGATPSFALAAGDIVSVSATWELA